MRISENQLAPSEKTALQIIRLATEQAEQIKWLSESVAIMLEDTAKNYDGDEAVYTGRNVANILSTEATRIRLKLAPRS